MKTREEIKANRLKFAKGLQESHREKFTSRLEDFNNSNSRCCLGHACEILNLKREVHEETVFYNNNTATAPNELIELLGLKSDLGHGINFHVGKLYYGSLASLNDSSPLTTQEIGKLVEGWVEGGDSTPFVDLRDYPTL